MNLQKDGFALIRGELAPDTFSSLRGSIFQNDRPGERCLLDLPEVRGIALALKSQLVAMGHLPGPSVAIQAIAFDKNTDTNWKVPWHQDLMFPFAARVSSAGYELPSLKQGVDYARPPAMVLGQLLAARLHLDDCGSGNGPLRVSPSTHDRGIIPSGEISQIIGRQGEEVCLAGEGEVLLMRPLLLHASSQASEPKHRRVLHFVYHTGEPIPERWHRAV